MTHAPDPATLRVAVLAAEQAPATNRLWYEAAPAVEELRVFAPQESDEPTPGLQVDLPPVQRLGRQQSGRVLRGLQRELADFRPDVIHINAEAWALSVMRRALGRRQCVIVHGAENQFTTDLGKRWVRHRLTHLVSAGLSGYASWNVAGAQAVSRMRPGLPTLVLPAVIPPASFPPASWRPRPGPDFRLLLLGRLVPEKGFADVIEAVSRTPGREHYDLVVCGLGPDRPRLEALARDAGVRLDMRGQLAPAALAQLMAESECLVQPSRTTWAWAEQFGRTVAEGMTVGLPALVSDSGELPNLVGSPAYVFPEGDADALSRLLEAWRTDRMALAAASADQAARARLWSPEQAVPRIIAFWSEARAYFTAS